MKTYLISVLIQRGMQFSTAAKFVACPDEDSARKMMISDTESKWPGWLVSVGSVESYNTNDLLGLVRWALKHAQEQVDEMRDSQKVDL